MTELAADGMTIICVTTKWAREGGRRQRHFMDGGQIVEQAEPEGFPRAQAQAHADVFWGNPRT